MIPTLIGRGCINRCTFCSEWERFQTYRSRSAINIYNEIAFQKKNYPFIEELILNDSLINGDIKVLDGLCNLLIENKTGIKWGGQAVIRREMSAAFLKKMRQAGCYYLSYGVESGSNDILRLMRKAFTAELANRVIRQTRKAGMDESFNIIVGFPGEDERRFAETIGFVKNNLEYVNMVTVNPLYLSRELMADREKWGIAVPANGDSDDWATKDGANNEEVRFDRLKALRDIANNKLSIHFDVELEYYLKKGDRLSRRKDKEEAVRFYLRAKEINKDKNFERVIEERIKFCTFAKMAFGWDIHYKCNFRCPYCWFYKEWISLVRRNIHLAPDECFSCWRRIYDKYGELEIEITGGEPFIYPNFTELIEQLSGIHKLIIATNLSIGVKDFIDKVDSSRVKVIPTFHPLFAKFEPFLENALLLKENGFTDNIIYLAYPVQIKQISYYAERFSRKGLGFLINNFWGEYKGVSYPDGYTKEEREIISCHSGKCADANFRSPSEIMSAGHIFPAGQRRFVIQADGNVVGYDGSELFEAIGNFFDENFMLSDKPILSKAEQPKGNEPEPLLIRRADAGAIKVNQDNRIDETLDLDSIGGLEVKSNIAASPESFENGPHKKSGLDNRPIYLENKELNNLEVKERKIILESKPMMLNIIITDQCNLSCIMCRNTRRSGRNTLDKLAFRKITELLPYLIRIIWQGGEIFYVDYLKEAFRSLVPYPHITHEIVTNGLLLDEEWIEILLNLNLNLAFSIDSAAESTYEYIRKGARFGELKKRLQLLNEMEKKSGREIERTMYVVVMKSNHRELDLCVDFAKEYSFQKILFSPVLFLDADDEENIFSNMGPDVRCVLEKTFEKVKNKAVASKVGVSSMVPDFIFDIPCAYKKQNNKPENIDLDLERQGLYCVYPWKEMCIDVSRQGNIYADCWCWNNIGNIYKDYLLEAWNNEPMRNYRRNLASGNKKLCKVCVDNNRIF